MQPAQDKIVWKDIANIKDEVTKLEAQRFWACLMFLEIMPPKLGKKGGSEWKYAVYSETMDKVDYIYTPQCRYDEFVASHASACEHRTEYFIYYHRNLMSKYVVALQ